MVWFASSLGIGENAMLGECPESKVWVFWRLMPNPQIIAVSDNNMVMNKILENFGVFSGACRKINDNYVFTVQDEDTEMDFRLDLVKLNDRFFVDIESNLDWE
jgi:hypothetical protein